MLVGLSKRERQDPSIGLLSLPSSVSGRRRLPQSSREAELCSSSRPSMAAWPLYGGADRPVGRTLGASGAGNAVKVRKRGGVVCLSRYLSSDEYSNVVS
jgi:hypothetical protein